MSFALKRKFPNIYIIFRKFEKYIPAWTKLWDNKAYLVNLKIISMIRYWRHYPRLKAEADAVFQNYNGGDFIDIGAYQGVYSFLLAPKANKNDSFISCEPDPKIKKELLENLILLRSLFRDINFSSLNIPVGNGEDVFKSETDCGHPVFKKDKNIDIKNFNSNKIRSISVDEIVKKKDLNPKLIKIDVEGAELNVLEGMINVLKLNKPILMIEKHPTLIPTNAIIELIDDLLIKNGYKREIEIFKDDIAITEIWKSS